MLLGCGMAEAKQATRMVPTRASSAASVLLRIAVAECERHARVAFVASGNRKHGSTQRNVHAQAAGVGRARVPGLACFIYTVYINDMLAATSLDRALDRWVPVLRSPGGAHPLRREGSAFVDTTGRSYPVEHGILRLVTDSASAGATPNGIAFTTFSHLFTR